MITIALASWLVGCRTGPEGLVEARRLLDAGDLEGAKAAYGALVARAPDDPAALTGHGWTLLYTGEGDRAKESFEHCRQVAPQDAECIRGLGAVLQDIGNTQGAATLFEEALALAPTDHKVRSSVALNALIRGDAATAEQIYAQLVQEVPEEAGYRVGLTEIAIKAGRLDEARAQVEAASRIASVPARTRALLDLQQGRIGVASAESMVEAGCERADGARAELGDATTTLDRLLADGARLPQLSNVRAAAESLREKLDRQCPVGGVTGMESSP